MSRSVAEVMGNMPFSGKHAVKYWYQKGREASRNGEVRGKLTNAAALGSFAVLHAIQLSMGVTELTHDTGQNPLVIGIDALYTAANAMAAYTQTYLAAKVLHTSKETRSTAIATPDDAAIEGDAPEKRQSVELGAPSLTDAVVTVGGQALFLATIH